MVLSPIEGQNNLQGNNRHKEQVKSKHLVIDSMSSLFLQHYQEEYHPRCEVSQKIVLYDYRPDQVNDEDDEMVHISDVVMINLKGKI